MSFLNSVLSSISGSGSQQPGLADASQKIQTQDRRPPQNAAHTASKQSAPPSYKRKSDEILTERNGKIPKTNHNAAFRTGHGKADSVSRTFTNAKATAKPTVSALNSSSPSSERIRTKSTPSAIPSTAVKPSSESQKKEPKKGSYAEIMARAQANQGKPQAAVPISHKPREKMAMSYKKELKLQKEAIRDKKLGRASKDGMLPSSSDSHSTKSANIKPAKKGPQPSYSGTMKPLPKPQPTYRGTMNPATANAVPKPRNGSHSAKRRLNEYAATDDELDDDEQSVEDDGYGYDSEESDNMEAGFSDVEQEETAAAKAARLEDQKEAEVEARLKREKEEKKRKLEALAKRAKPQRY